MIDQALFESNRQSAFQLAAQLKRRKSKIVFAESCTAGLAAAVVAQVSGISNWLCGSAVTYRESVKQSWLGIDSATIEQHTAVSWQVTQLMAASVLRKTIEASLSVGITGHLEPTDSTNSPYAFVALACRADHAIFVNQPTRLELKQMTRVGRQWETVGYALKLADDHLNTMAANFSDDNNWTRLPDSA